MNHSMTPGMNPFQRFLSLKDEIRATTPVWNNLQSYLASELPPPEHLHEVDLPFIGSGMSHVNYRLGKLPSSWLAVRENFIERNLRLRGFESAAYIQSAIDLHESGFRVPRIVGPARLISNGETVRHVILVEDLTHGGDYEIEEIGKPGAEWGLINDEKVYYDLATKMTEGRHYVDKYIPHAITIQSA